MNKSDPLFRQLLGRHPNGNILACHISGWKLLISMKENCLYNNDFIIDNEKRRHIFYLQNTSQVSLVYLSLQIPPLWKPIVICQGVSIYKICLVLSFLKSIKIENVVVERNIFSKFNFLAWDYWKHTLSVETRWSNPIGDRPYRVYSSSSRYGQHNFWLNGKH